MTTTTGFVGRSLEVDVPRPRPATAPATAAVDGNTASIDVLSEAAAAAAAAQQDQEQQQHRVVRPRTSKDLSSAVSRKPMLQRLCPWWSEPPEFPGNKITTYKCALS